MIWEKLAYAARYGCQPLSVLRRMTLPDLTRFCNELTKIVKEENRPRADS